eukprot:TRINITY_DN3998_c0_g1_i1.p1 TRINITY_DN3998_c0_g1~~TRINITY_DN3998_c0_g1_i1.p1  ORF type:complete len:704 (-),score=158.05 TRINITY_DN3998_c0_g1_i1:123-2099(-)
MEEDLDEEERAMVNAVRKSGYQAADIPQGIVDEDDGAPAASVRRELTPEVAEEVAEDEEEEGSEAEEADQHVAPRELLQEAFQPTSIPDGGETGISTLACNAYGTITRHETADGPPAVVITPADQAKYKPARIAGHYVKLAALGKTGAALGCCPPEGITGSSNSYVMFKALDTWASNSSWSLHFAAHEDILGLGINSKYVAVFTSRFMRVFTASGIESAVLSFPHRFVACAGCEKALLAVACDDGGTELKVSVFDLQARTAVHSLLPVALTLGTHMMWLGWSDDAVLSTCDTAGVVRCLHSDFGAQWVPMYDPLTRPDQARYWPTGLDRQRLYGIPCKPGANHPAPTADLTVPQSVDLQIPLTPTDRMEYRERYLRTLYKAEELKRHAIVYTPEIQDADKEMDRCSFTLFEAALERDQTQRAFDHAACFNLRSTYETAMKRAHAKGHTALLRGMTEVLQRRFSKLRRLCPLPDPGQKERQRELQDRKLQEKIQKLVPVPVAAPAPVPRRRPTAFRIPMRHSCWNRNRPPTPRRRSESRSSFLQFPNTEPTKPPPRNPFRKLRHWTGVDPPSAIPNPPRRRAASGKASPARPCHQTRHHVPRRVPSRLSVLAASCKAPRAPWMPHCPPFPLQFPNLSHHNAFPDRAPPPAPLKDRQEAP